MEKRVRKVLEGVVHPAKKQNIVEAGMVGRIVAGEGRVEVELVFPAGRDPFLRSLRRRVVDAIVREMPDVAVDVVVREAQAEVKKSGMDGVAKVVAISSAKGGVGKSTVAANLAVAMAGMGLRVGLLDADIYGPSQPIMFGVEGYRPVAVDDSEGALMEPAEAWGVKVMSIGFFIEAGDALAWRSPMAVGALKQLMNQTEWGELDILLIDMPPGTGDVQLTVLQELRVDGAVVVSTPQRVALADTERGIGMLRLPAIGVRILGVVENMAWFTPAELPDNKYYIFGRGGAAEMAAMNGIAFLGEIPVVMSVMEGGERGVPAAMGEGGEYYVEIAGKVVDKLG